MKTATVVYEIVSDADFAKRNLLGEVKDGMRALRVAAGDACAARDALRDLMPYVLEDYWPDFATPAYKAAVEAAKEVAK